LKKRYIKDLSLSRIIPPLAFFLIPFLGGNHLTLFYITIDRFWIETTFSMLLVISVLMIFYEEHKRNKSILNSANGLNTLAIFISPFIFFNLLSLVYTWNLYNSLIEINSIAWMMASIFIFYLYKEKEILIKALVVSMTLVVFIMVFQFLFLFPSLKVIFTEGKEAFFLSKKNVPFASFLNESTLAGYFLFFIPLTIYYGLIKKSIFFKVTSIIIIFGLFFTISRMGIFIGFLTLLIIGFILLKKRDYGSIMFLILITVISIGIFITFFYISGKKDIDISDPEAQYNYEMKKKLKKVGSDIKTLNYRTESWKKSTPAIAERPLFGYGAGTFEYAYRKHYDGDFYTKYAHNILLKAWVELGLFGALSFILYVIGIFFNFKKLKDDFYKFIFISCMVGLFFALSNVTFETPAYVITFFLLSSIFFIWNKENGDKKVMLSREHALILLFCFAIMLCLSFYFTAKSDMSKKTIEDGKVFEENGFWTDAFKSYKCAIEDMPLNNEGYISAINILINSLKNEKDIQIREKIKGGIIYYLKKVEEKKDKDSDLFYIMGKGYSTLGDTYKAEEYFKKALFYYPSSGFYRYQLAQFYYQNGELIKTKQMIDYIESYKDRYRKSGNLNGFYVYMARDLKADIFFREGRKDMALMVAQENLNDAEKGVFIISDPRAREYVNREVFINYLRNRANFYKSKI